MRRSDDNMAEFPAVVQSWQISLIERFIQSISEVKRLLEIGLQVILHDLIDGPSNSILINILKNIVVDNIDFIAFLFPK